MISARLPSPTRLSQSLLLRPTATFFVASRLLLSRTVLSRGYDAAHKLRCVLSMSLLRTPLRLPSAYLDLARETGVFRRRLSRAAAVAAHALSYSPPTLPTL